MKSEWTEFLGKLKNIEEARRLFETPAERLVKLLLEIHRPQHIPDPGPELRSALEALVVHDLAAVIEDPARRADIQKSARLKHFH